MKTTWKSTLPSVAAMAMFAWTMNCYAGSLTQPGETIGLATGAPIPEGLIFFDGPNWGANRNLSSNSTLFVNTPVLLWSTPWTLAGARLEFLFSAPTIYVDDPRSNAAGITAMYNPFASVMFAWNLGNGLGFTHYEGAYSPINNGTRQNFWTYNNRNALSYTADGWNLTAYSVLGITMNDENLGVKVAPNYFNYDLTAAKKFDKWTFGVGAFGSFDISRISTPGYRKQSQFAVGPFVGYDFGGLNVHLYATRDVYAHNYTSPITNKTNYDTRVWTRFVFPLWSPPAAAEPVLAKY